MLADERLVISGVSDKRAGMSSPRMGERYVEEQAARKFFDDHFVVEADDRAGREDRQAQMVLENWIESGDYDEKLTIRRPAKRNCRLGGLRAEALIRKEASRD